MIFHRQVYIGKSFKFLDVKNKLNLVLASNTDLPDVFLSCGISNDMLVKYGSQGVFLLLNEYIDEYGVELKKVFEHPNYPGLKNMITAPDGNIYSLFSINGCYNCTYDQKMWISQPFLDALGLNVPTTTEEFYNVLKAFKEQDPNGNGKADEIPLVASTNGWRVSATGFIMNAFIYDDGGYSASENGRSVYNPDVFEQAV